MNDLVMQLVGPEPMLAAPRSPGWDRFAREWLLEFPACALCGRVGHCVPHHKVPFHLRRDLEFDRENIVTLCQWPTLNCHLWGGHRGNWSDYREDVDDFISKYAAAVRLLAGRAA